jgi:hypothetical protein
LFVALAVLSLLSDVAEEQALICVVDDEQWLDRASAQVLAFVARRLEAESVGLVFAARGRSDELAGLPELVVEGLREGDALALLDSALTGPLDARVRDQIVSETRGNPLALLELPRGVKPAELAGRFGLPGAVPLSRRIEESFQRRLDALPVETRRLLLLAAADPVGEPSLLWRAAQRLAIGTEGATPAAELIEATLQESTPGDLGVIAGTYASSVLYNGLGRHDAARDAAWRAFQRDPAGRGPFLVSELAEAASRTATSRSSGPHSSGCQNAPL